MRPAHRQEKIIKGLSTPRREPPRTAPYRDKIARPGTKKKAEICFRSCETNSNVVFFHLTLIGLADYYYHCSTPPQPYYYYYYCLLLNTPNCLLTHYCLLLTEESTRLFPTQQK